MTLKEVLKSMGITKIFGPKYKPLPQMETSRFEAGMNLLLNLFETASKPNTRAELH